MALRNIRTDDDEVLKKTSKEVKRIDEKIKQLIDDMKETMYKNDGVGLAAPQVGILKRIVVIDVGDGQFVLINPKIITSSGKKVDVEGCLSVLQYVGMVERPTSLKVQGFNENFNKVEYNVKDLFARAVCHEIDHLDGILFTDRAIEIIDKRDLQGEDN